MRGGRRKAGGGRFEVALLRKACRPTGGLAVGRFGGAEFAEHLEQVAPNGGEAVVPGHTIVVIERVRYVEAGLRSLHHRHRGGLIQRHHRAGCEVGEQPVQRDDLWPVSVLWGRNRDYRNTVLL